MFYRINAEDGYIHGIVAGVNAENSNCTEAEYEKVKAILLAAPSAPDGFYYRLRENFEWELCEDDVFIEAPEETDDISELEAKATAYDILMGVSE